MSRMKTKFNKILSVFVAAMILLTATPFSLVAQAANVGTLADLSTHHQWHDNLQHSTKEIGRIWTD